MELLTLLAGASANQPSAVFDAGTPQASCSLTTAVSGSPSFSVQLQGSADTVTWASIGSAVTTAGTSSLTPSPAARYFRAILSGYSGPGSVTARLGINIASSFPPTSQDPLEFGSATTAGPFAAVTAKGVPAANYGTWTRMTAGGYAFSHLTIYVTAQSGNVSVGAYSSTGSGASAAPAAQLATSGAVPCPAVGLATIALGSSCAPPISGWMALSADNATAQFASNTQFYPSGILNIGVGAVAAASHPLPSSAVTSTLDSYLMMMRGS